MLKSKTDKTKQDVHEQNNFFNFDNNFYLETDGVAIGSPVGLTLANVFLCHYEIRMIHNFVIHFKHGTSN